MLITIPLNNLLRPNVCCFHSVFSHDATDVTDDEHG